MAEMCSGLLHLSYVPCFLSEIKHLQMGLFVDEIPSILFTSEKNMLQIQACILSAEWQLVFAGVRTITMDRAKHATIPKLALKELVLE